MYQDYYRKQKFKSGCMIALIFIFAIFSTYFIYEKFSKQREKDYDSGEMEVIFHEKNGNQIHLTQFVPVTDSVGLSSNSYTFTVENNTAKDISYIIKLVKDEKAIINCGCQDRQIPIELLKLSFRKDHLAPTAFVLSEYPDGILQTDTLKAGGKEDYSIRLWAMRSNFMVDKTSHFHASIQVIEE